MFSQCEETPESVRRAERTINQEQWQTLRIRVLRSTMIYHSERRIRFILDEQVLYDHRAVVRSRMDLLYLETISGLESTDIQPLIHKKKEVPEIE